MLRQERMKQRLLSEMALAMFAFWLVPNIAVAQITPSVSGDGCNNPSYTPNPAGPTIQLCNDPLADGLFTEDGVVGYQYIYDVFMGSGYGGSFHLGGTIGPLGPAGAFKGSDSAWYRTPPNHTNLEGVWQTWGIQSVTDTGTNSHHQGGFGGSAEVSSVAPVWSEADNAALGNTNTDVWDTSVTFNPVHDWFATGATSAAGQPIPWALNNSWHTPSEYGWSSEFFAPGPVAGASHITGDTGVAWQSLSGIFLGGDMQLQHTLRIVAPYEPGSINYGLVDPSSGIITGPDSNSPIVEDFCFPGDLNLDGFVDIGGDVLPAFTNFTGPGSFCKTRIEGDVHGDPWGNPCWDGVCPGGDGDVDVQDLLTIFGNFTGPPPDSGAIAEGSLVAAEAGDANVPDLIYDPVTGEVTLDVDGAGIIGYVLKNGSSDFAFLNHAQILAGVKTSVAGELSEAAFASSVGANSIGNVFPTGMNLAALTAYLTVNDVSTSLGAPVVPFDLVVLSTGPAVPEPSTMVLAVLGMAGMALVAYHRRRTRSREGVAR